MGLALDAPGAAERFVRGTLGCGCADEVFRRVTVERDLTVSGSRLAWRIDVGGRLLVYVLEPRGAADLEARLDALVRAGRADRDARGFNRLRVVVAADDPERLAAPAQVLFGRSGAVDERVHLHVVGLDGQPRGDGSMPVLPATPASGSAPTTAEPAEADRCA